MENVGSRKISIVWTVLVLFVISLALKNTSFAFLPALFGLPLLFFIPGHSVNNLIFKNERWFVRWPLDIISSISVGYLGYFIFKSHIGYSFPTILGYMLTLNVTASFCLTRDSSRISRAATLSFLQKNWKLLAVFALPILFVLVRYLINPYIYESDSLFYILVYRNIVSSGKDFSFLTRDRGAFAFIMTANGAVTGISPVTLFKLVLPMLLFLVAPIYYQLCEKITRPRLAALVYLLILAAPIISITNEKVRPEIFVPIFALPVLLLLWQSLRERSASRLIVAFVYAAVASRFHEFGFFLLFAALVALLVAGLRYVSFIWSKPDRYGLISLLALAVAPYLWIAKIYSASILALLPQAYINIVKGYFFTHLSQFHWRWWFLNSYTTIDGGSITLPGISGILYYVYNGIGLIAIILALLLVLRRHRLRIWPSLTGFVDALPLTAYFTLLVLIAEILPRFGIPLLPNRVWPYLAITLMIAGAKLIAVLAGHLSEMAIKRLSGLLIVGIIFGVIVSVYGSVLVGAMVLNSERSGIARVQSLESNSLIISTQPNDILTEIYANKEFLRLSPDLKFTDQEDFKKNALIQLRQSIEKQRDDLVAGVSAELVTVQSQFLYGAEVGQTETTVKQDPTTAIDVLRLYDQTRYKELVGYNEKLADLNSQPVYFVYSFAKLNGIGAKLSPQWKAANNSLNYDFFTSLRSSALYSDKEFVIFRLN